MPCVHTAVVQSSVQKLRLSTVFFFCRWYLNVHRKLKAKIRILTSAFPMFVSHQVDERQCSYLTIDTSKDSGVNGIPNLYVHEINKYYWSPEGNHHANVVFLRLEKFMPFECSNMHCHASLCRPNQGMNLLIVAECQFGYKK